MATLALPVMQDRHWGLNLSILFFHIVAKLRSDQCLRPYPDQNRRIFAKVPLGALHKGLFVGQTEGAIAFREVSRRCDSESGKMWDRERVTTQFTTQVVTEC